MDTVKPYDFGDEVDGEQERLEANGVRDWWKDDQGKLGPGIEWGIFIFIMCAIAFFAGMCTALEHADEIATALALK